MKKPPSLPLLQRGKTASAAFSFTSTIPPFAKEGLGGTYRCEVVRCWNIGLA